MLNESNNAGVVAGETSSGHAHGNGPSQQHNGSHHVLRALMQAYLYAQDVLLSPWEFALEWKILQTMGLSLNDARWLMAKRYVEHAHELTSPTDTARTFGPIGISCIADNSCFVLTSTGFEFATALHAERHEALPLLMPTALIMNHLSNGGIANSRPAVLPRWDCDLREIRYDGQLVKQFKLPSPNQEAILMTFEEEKWPTRVDDPLPRTANCDPKQRLHDTIRSLNRNQKNRLLRFKGDGTGEGVIWEPRTDNGEETPE
jgi:hypothetical protein